MQRQLYDGHLQYRLQEYFQIILKRMKSLPDYKAIEHDQFHHGHELENKGLLLMLFPSFSSQ